MGEKSETLMEHNMGLSKNVTSLFHISLNCNEHMPVEAETKASRDRNEYQAIQVHCHTSVMIHFQ